MNAKLCVAVAAVLLFSAACTASAAECYAFHTGYKSSIPLGAFSIYGGCIKGSVGSYAGVDNLCLVPGGEGGSGNYATRAACCAALEPEVQGPNPQTRQPRPENKNIKALCLAGRKITDQELKDLTSAPAECFSIENAYKYDIPLGALGTEGGCLKGTFTAQKTCRFADGKESGSGNFATRAACCTALEPMVQGPNPMDMTPRPWNKDVKALCLAGKQLSAKDRDALTAANAVPTNWVVFKGQDLGAATDIPAGGNDKFIKVCRGLEYAANACKAHPKCVAFTFGGDGDCGYLKLSFVDAKGASQFKASPKWTTYVLADPFNKAKGKAVNLPSSSGTQKA